MNRKTKRAQLQKTKRKRQRKQRRARAAHPRESIERSFITANFAETGIARLVLFGRGDGGGTSGCFFVDLHRVGVIDCFVQMRLTAAQSKGELDYAERDQLLRPIEPGDARKVLLACLGYSRELGLSPDNTEESVGLFVDPRAIDSEGTGAPKDDLDRLLAKLADADIAKSPEGLEIDPMDAAAVRMDAHRDSLLDERIGQLTHAAKDVECRIGRGALNDLLRGFLDPPEAAQLQ